LFFKRDFDGENLRSTFISNDSNMSSIKCENNEEYPYGKTGSQQIETLANPHH